MLEDLVYPACAYALMVFFKAFQQRNVAHLHYVAAIPSSYALTFTDMFIIAVVAVKAVGAESLWELVPLGFALGTGGWIGSLSAMWVHEKFLTRKSDVQD